MLSRHEGSVMHREALEQERACKMVRARGGIKEALDKQVTLQRQALIAAMKCLYWLCKQEIAHTTNYEPLLSLVKNLGCTHLSALNVGGNAHYTSERIIQELVITLAQQIEDSQLHALRTSPFYGLMIDESTDVSITKHLVLYGRYISELGEPCSTFLRIVDLVNGTAECIEEAIRAYLVEKELPTNKMMGFGSDGAAVMTGRVTGVATRDAKTPPDVTATDAALNDELKEFNTRIPPIIKDTFNKHVRQPFFNLLLQNLNDRFTFAELLQGFDIFILPPYAATDEERDKVSHNYKEKLQLLISHYGTGEDAPVSAEKLRKEWESFYYMLQDHYSNAKAIEVMKDLVNEKLNPVYPQLSCLANLALVIPINTADCERAFSTMKRVKTRIRNRLKSVTLDALLRISIQGPSLDEFDFESAKQYQFFSTLATLIYIFFDIADIISVLFISYCGERGHKHRWLGADLVIQGLGCLVFATPQFFFGAPTSSGGKHGGQPGVVSSGHPTPPNLHQWHHEGLRKTLLFENCSCVAEQLQEEFGGSHLYNSSATTGVCDKDTCNGLYIFLRTLALGLQSIIFCVFGNIPGSLLFGAIFDSACTLWQYNCGSKGECWVYSNSDISYRAVGLGLSGAFLTFLFSFLTWVVYPRMSGEEEGVGVAGKVDVSGEDEVEEGGLAERLTRRISL
ncbi:hypothetical protein EMCRGX_G015277 [Ephydatia muelleri]